MLSEASTSTTKTQVLTSCGQLLILLDDSYFAFNNHALSMKNEAEIGSKGFDLSDYDLLDHPALELFEQNSFIQLLFLEET